MSSLERFGAYAEACASDDWSVLEPYFNEDAVYDFIAAPPLGGRHESRATILRDFQDAVNGFDRRFNSRRIELMEGPMEGEGRAVFEGDRISLMEDKVTDEEGQRLGAYMEAQGDKLKPV